MNPEKPSVNSNVNTNTGWESLAAYRDNTKKTERAPASTTIGSAIKNVSERATTTGNKFIEEWMKKRDQKKMTNLQHRGDLLEEARAKNDNSLDDAEATANQSRNKLSELDSESSVLGDEIQMGNKRLNDMKAEHSVGNYIRTQSEQIGSILKSNKEVVKSALGAFTAKVVTKLPRIEISIKTAEKVAGADWNQNIHDQSAERRAAKTKIETMREAQERFESAKNARSEAISGLSTNHENWRGGIKDISKTRAELRQANNELSGIIAERRGVEKAKREALARIDYFEKQKDVYEEKIAQCTEAIDTINQRVIESKERIGALGAMVKFQKEIGSKSPARMRENIENKLDNIEKAKQEKLEDMLFMKGVDSIEELSDADRARVEKRLEKFTTEASLLESQRDALDQYESLRQEQSRRILSNPKASKGIGGAFSSLRRTIAAMF